MRVLNNFLLRQNFLTNINIYEVIKFKFENLLKFSTFTHIFANHLSSGYKIIMNLDMKKSHLSGIFT
jgi:hypothetical protein